MPLTYHTQSEHFEHTQVGQVCHRVLLAIKFQLVAVFSPLERSSYTLNEYIQLNVNKKETRIIQYREYDRGTKYAQTLLLFRGRRCTPRIRRKLASLRAPLLTPMFPQWRQKNSVLTKPLLHLGWSSARDLFKPPFQGVAEVAH